MGRRSNQTKGVKKELYTGDPNATMTMCVKKLRRHLESDLQMLVVQPVKPGTVDKNGEVLSDEAIKSMGLDKKTYMFICKHCKQVPHQ